MYNYLRLGVLNCESFELLNFYNILTAKRDMYYR